MLGSAYDGVPVLRSKPARRRAIWIPLVTVTAAVLIAWLLVSGASGESRVVGAGSTLAQPLVEESAVAYRDANAAENDAVTDERYSWIVDSGDSDWVVDGSGFDYEPVGSTGGIVRLENPEVDFALSDYPLSEEALDDRALVQFPIAIGSVALVHSLPLEDGEVLRLDADTIAAIYLGEITSWDDSAIAELNPDVELPDLEITPVHRTDGSGSTVAFTNYLAANSPAWADGPGAGNSIDWPEGVGAERSGGLIEEMAGTEGAVGYVEPSQAQEAGLGTAEIGNASGAFVGATIEGMSAAAEGNDWNPDDFFSEPLNPGSDAEAYPMTTAIYALMRQDGGGDTRRVLSFLSFLMADLVDRGHSADSVADSGYLALPSSAIDAAQDLWRTTYDVSITDRP